MHKKIEIDILFFLITEAMFLLFFFKESILTMFIGTILGGILIYLTKNIKNNKIGKFILFITAIPISLITLYKIICFINYNILKNYSLYVILIPFLILSIYLISKNYHTMIKSMEISFYIFIFIKAISFILIIPKINISNINFIYNDSINYKFIIIGISILFIYKGISYLTNYKISKNNMLIALINPLLIKTFVILVIGNTLAFIYKYPYMDYLKTIKYFDFIERIDGILSFQYLISFYYLFIFLLFIIKLCIKKTDKSV